MKIFNIKAIAFTGLFLGLAQTSAVGFTLDAFSSYESPASSQGVGLPLSGSPSNGSVTQSNLDSSVVFGDSRTIELERLSDSSAFGSGPSFGATQSTGELALFTPDVSAKGQVIYDGLDEGQMVNGVDVVDIEELDAQNQPTLDSFEITISSMNIGEDSIEQGTTEGVDLVLGFEVKDDSNNSAMVTQTLYKNDFVAPDSVFFPYSDLAGVDLQRVDYIRFFTDDENEGDDFRFSLVQGAIQPQEVPFEFSPGLGLILGGGFFSFLKLRKKFQQN